MGDGLAFMDDFQRQLSAAPAEQMPAPERLLVLAGAVAECFGFVGVEGHVRRVGTPGVADHSCLDATTIKGHARTMNAR
ncbi:hypothetical protein [Nocardiopsis deserti]|uniref:hypothetical protein n=1 Tax=Nocardiopsis deserti TaxID=2605988 RepID=UPI0012387D42|nr:hypothetical protein [Nocardiopsis deserti]